MLCTHLPRVRFPLSPTRKSLDGSRSKFAKHVARVRIPPFPKYIYVRENSLIGKVQPCQGCRCGFNSHFSRWHLINSRMMAEWSMAVDCKSMEILLIGSNPIHPTSCFNTKYLLLRRCSSMVEPWNHNSFVGGSSPSIVKISNNKR